MPRIAYKFKWASRASKAVWILSATGAKRRTKGSIVVLKSVGKHTSNPRIAGNPGGGNVDLVSESASSAFQ